MLNSRKNRYGKLIIVLHYRSNTPNKNKLKTTISYDCFLEEVDKSMSSILNLYPWAETIKKATFNNRIIK